MSRPRLPRVDWVMAALALGALMTIAATLRPVRAAVPSLQAIEIIDADDLARVLLRCSGAHPLRIELGTSPLALVCANAEVVPPPVPPLFRDGFE